MIEVMSEKDIQKIADDRRQKYNLDSEDDFLLITPERDYFLFGYLYAGVWSLNENFETVAFKEKYGFINPKKLRSLAYNSGNTKKVLEELLEHAYRDPNFIFLYFDYDESLKNLKLQVKKALSLL